MEFDATETASDLGKESGILSSLQYIANAIQDLVSKRTHERARCSESVTQQFVNEVAGFSSQYGRENGLCYTAANLKGPPNMYPRYGDFAECFLMVYL